MFNQSSFLTTKQSLGTKDNGVHEGTCWFDSSDLPLAGKVRVVFFDKVHQKRLNSLGCFLSAFLDEFQEILKDFGGAHHLQALDQFALSFFQLLCLVRQPSAGQRFLYLGKTEEAEPGKKFFKGELKFVFLLRNRGEGEFKIQKLRSTQTQ
jgi:hypothetical protein